MEINKMRLEDWRHTKKRGGKPMSYSVLANGIGVSHATVARRYCLPFQHKDFSRPAEEIMLNIQEFTMGAVKPNDFYNLPKEENEDVTNVA
jgi:hypothetical protein